MEEQLEAAILQNFLLVQADKHGHHLLASLPTIAASYQPKVSTYHTPDLATVNIYNNLRSIYVNNTYFRHIFIKIVQVICQ